MRNVLTGISLRIKLFCLTVLVAGCPPHHIGTVDFGKLKPTQLRLLDPSPDLQRKRWGSLNPSQQLEFAGVTQALDDYYQHVLLQLRLEHPPALEEVLAISNINGSIPSAGSPGQFNLEVSWKGGAKDLFHQDKTHWWTHLPWLHAGYHGYTQIKYWDPFLGLVVLFDDQDVTKGQIHIDFRDLVWHFFPDNGNIAANYDYYCDWYGQLSSYSILCRPESELRQRMPAGVPNVSPPDPVKAGKVVDNMSTQRNLQVDEGAMKAVQDSLEAWYKDRQFARFLTHVATDNFFEFRPQDKTQTAGYSALPLKSPEKAWKDVFDGAFTSPSARHMRFRGELTQELRFAKPSLPPEVGNRLNFLKVPARAEYAFEALDPLSAPEGSLFPPPDLPPGERKKFDAVACYLDYLNRNYAQKKKLFVVGYATNDPGLVREGGVQYWIYQDGKWGLSFFHGTD